MSRIGNKPVAIPKGVEIKLDGNTIRVKGPKGELSRELPLSDVAVKVDNGQVQVTRANDAPPVRARHGLVRALIQSMVTGASTGFERKLEINGVGYRAEVKGQALNFALGYSHPIEFPLPKGISAKVDKNVVILSGSDKELLGQTAARVRELRPPEPYKGKGIKYAEEQIRRKVGKTGAA